MKVSRVLSLLVAILVLHEETNLSLAARSSGGRSYSRYSYSRSYTYRGYARYSYRYSSSYYTYRSSSVRRIPSTYRTSLYYRYYTGLYYYYYSYSTYNSYYGGLCYYSVSGSTSRSYCSTTTTTTAAPTRAPVPVCPSSATLTSSVGSFQSHSSWDGSTTYSNMMSCSWSISVAAGETIRLNFVSFDVEKTHDEVIIYDGPNDSSSLLGIYFNSNLPPTYTYSSTNRLFIKFKTDFSITKVGFRAVYETLGAATPAPTTTVATTTTGATVSECPSSSTLHNSSGIIKSHQSQGVSQYPNSLTCSWTIMGEAGKRVKLEFVSMQLESCYDKVILYDGNSASGSQIVSLCRTSPPTIYFYSTGQSMHIKFTSDNSITRDGFLAIFELQATDTFASGSSSSVLTDPETRNSNSSNVCTNYDTNMNGTAIGSFTCPNPWEPEDFTQCCGEKESQYCCKLKDNTPMIVGIVIGVICGLIFLGVLIFCIAKGCRETKAPKQSAGKVWRRSLAKTRVLTAWKLYTPPTTTATQPKEYGRLAEDFDEDFSPPPIPPPSMIYGTHNNDYMNDYLTYPPPHAAYPPVPVMPAPTHNT